MAKRQSNIGLFERAGYALGASKSPQKGFDYLKGIAVAMKDVDSINASISKTQNLIDKNPGGREIPKISDTTFPKVSEWLLSKKDDIANAHKLSKTGTDEEKDEAIKFLNNIDTQVQQLNKDLEGAALAQKNAYDIESGTATYTVDGKEKILNYAKANNSYQLQNHQALANGELDENAVIQEDGDGNIRYMMPGIVDGQPVLTPWDDIDTGSTYDETLENNIDAMVSDANMLFNSVDKNGMPKGKDKMSEAAYKNTYRPKLEKELNDLLTQKGGKQAIKNYMYNDPRLIDTFISNQVGIPQTINGEANPKWEDFINGEPLFSDALGLVPTTYDEFVNSNKFFADFDSEFVGTILNGLDTQFENAQKVATESGGGGKGGVGSKYKINK